MACYCNGVPLQQRMSSTSLIAVRQRKGPWVEIARTAATRYLYSDGTNAVWFFRIRASINGRAGGGNVVRAQLDMTTEKIRQEFLQATQRDQDLAKQLQQQAQDLANLQALVEAPEWVDQAWPAGSIVKHDGGLYVAKQDVPVGTAITDTAYWSSIGQYASLAEAVGAIGVAMQQVTTDVQQVEQELQILAQDVRGVQSSLSGKADASAVQAMNTRLTQAENNISSLSQLISAVQSTLAGKADASAVQALQTQVTQIGNEVTSNSTAITSVRSQIGGSGNLLPNATFEGDVSGWSFVINQWNVSLTRNVAGPDWIPAGGSQAGWYGGFSPSGISVISSAAFPVEAGKLYMASVYTGAHRCQANLSLVFMDASGKGVGEVYATDTNSDQALGGRALSAWKRLYTPAYEAPAGAASASVQLFSSGMGGVDPYVFFTQAMVEMVPAGKTMPSPWSPGSQGVDSKYAAATQSMSTRLTTAENGVASYFASWNLSLDVNGRIVGIRSINNGTTGTIDFVFDKVRFLSPSAGGARAELVNGNYFVWAPNGVRVVALGWSF